MALFTKNYIQISFFLTYIFIDFLEIKKISPESSNQSKQTYKVRIFQGHGVQG